MNYKEALDFIHSTNKFGSKLGLDNITRLLASLGNPQKHCPIVHVAGTNGKGSTVSYIAEVLKQSGYKTGKFISPFIERFSERISINGVEISDDDFVELVIKVKQKSEEITAAGDTHPTEFELITAIAFMYYAWKECDLVVLEVGLGGRLDATNVIECPELAVITPLSLDHTHILGDTLAEIAFEKAGIIKEKGDVVCFRQDKTALDVIQAVCLEKNARLKIVSAAQYQTEDKLLDGGAFEGKWADGETVKANISLIGTHQINNAILAFETLKILKEKGYDITKKSLIKGFLQTKWAGRLEIIRKKPLIMIDGAHNVSGAESLAAFLSKLDRKAIMIIGVLKDKDADRLLQLTAGFGERIYTISPHCERAMKSEQLAQLAKRYCQYVKACDKIEEALSLATESAGEDGIIIAFGSLYYIGEVKRLVISREYGG